MFPQPQINKQTNTKLQEQLAPFTLCEQAPKTTDTSLHLKGFCAERQGVANKMQE